MHQRIDYRQASPEACMAVAFRTEVGGYVSPHAAQR